MLKSFKPVGRKAPLAPKLRGNLVQLRDLGAHDDCDAEVTRNALDSYSDHSHPSRKTCASARPRRPKAAQQLTSMA